MTDNQGFYEEFKVTGDNVMAKVRELLEEGNVRRVFLKSEEGRTLLEIPLTAGVAVTAVATMFAPVLVAVGAVSALLTRVTIGVQRVAEPPAAAAGSPVADEPPAADAHGGAPADPPIA